MSISAQALAQLQAGLRQAPAIAERELLATVTEAALLVQHEVQDNIPHGATGLTRASVTAEAFSTPTGPLGVVGSSQPSALFLELGTKAHMPPVAALVPWVQAVMGLRDQEAQRVAFLVARKISRVGTKAQAPFARGLAAVSAQIDQMFEACAARIASQLGGAAA